MDPVPDPDDADDAMRRTFSDVMRIWIIPEIERRQATGALPSPASLRAAQVVLRPDGRPNTVRLNEEVVARARVKLHDGVKKVRGEVVYWHEIKAVEFAELAGDHDCGHITLMHVGGTWAISIDCRLNRPLAMTHLDASREFLRSADASITAGDLRPAIDALFSAAELAVTATLLLDAPPEFARKRAHRGIQRRFVEFGRWNLNAELVSGFNKLMRERDAARYLKRGMSMDRDAVVHYRDVVRRIIDDAAARSGAL